MFKKIPKIAVIASVSFLALVSGLMLFSSRDAMAVDPIPTTWTFTAECQSSGNCNIPDGYPTALIPDLREAVPQQVGLQNDHQKSFLRVSTSIANTGNGQWQMKAVIPATPDLPQEAEQQLLDANGNKVFGAIVSEFEYHPAHKHFHIADVTSQEIFVAGGGATDTNPFDDIDTGIGTEKVTFCLIDWIKISDNSPNTQRAYSACDGEFQGVSPGWMDQYHQELEGQELDVTDLATGYYFLVLTANPAHHFIESDFTNNSSWILFNYINDGKGNPKFEILNHSNCGDYPGLCEYSANR